MADQVQKVQETTTKTGDTVQTNRYVRDTTVADSSADAASGRRMFTNIIWFIDGAILVLLGFRFVLALLGANPANSFANFIYSASHPLVAPFFSLFSYNSRYGISRFEIYTLIAMLVYTVIAWGLTALVNLNRRTT